MHTAQLKAVTMKLQINILPVVKEKGMLMSMFVRLRIYYWSVQYISCFVNKKTKHRILFIQIRVKNYLQHRRKDFHNLMIDIEDQLYFKTNCSERISHERLDYIVANSHSE